MNKDDPSALGDPEQIVRMMMWPLPKERWAEALTLALVASLPQFADNLQTAISKLTGTKP